MEEKCKTCGVPVSSYRCRCDDWPAKTAKLPDPEGAREMNRLMQAAKPFGGPAA